MDSIAHSAPLGPQPMRLKDLACSAKFRGMNDLTLEGSNLLHKFVLERSEPHELGDEGDIRAVLHAMRDVSPGVANALNDFGCSALHLAVLKGNLSLVEKLLSFLSNIDVDARCEFRAEDSVALIIAARLGHLSIVRELLHRGADSDLLDRSRSTALCHAAWHDHVGAMELLASGGASVNPAGVRLTPLACAARSGNLAAVRYLVDKGADVNGAGDTGQTPLHTAAEMGNLAVVRFLVGEGADVHAANRFGMTPLHSSASVSPGVAAFLADRGADLRAADGDGMTALHFAADAGSAECAAVLVDRGADFRAADAKGWTPLHHAAREGHADVVAAMLERGADADARTGGGKTALDLAEERGRRSCADVLRRSRVSAPRCCVM